MRKKLFKVIAAGFFIIFLSVLLINRYSTTIVEKIHRYRIEARDSEKFKEIMTRKGFSYKDKKEELYNAATKDYIPFELTIFTKNSIKYVHYEIPQNVLQKLKEYKMRFEIDTVMTRRPKLIYSEWITLIDKIDYYPNRVYTCYFEVTDDKNTQWLDFYLSPSDSQDKAINGELIFCAGEYNRGNDNAVQG